MTTSPRFSHSTAAGPRMSDSTLAAGTLQDIQLRSGCRWHRRYVPTAVNCSDADSRLADSGLLRPGQCFRGAALDGFLQQSRRTPGTNAPGTIPPGPAVLQLFNGCQRLTPAIAERGLRIFLPIEKANGACFIITRPRVCRTIAHRLRSGWVWAMWVAFPCTSDNVTTAGLVRTREQIQRQLQLFDSTMSLCETAAKHRVLSFLENPRRSRAWRRHRLRRLLKLIAARLDEYDDCVFGTAYKKAQAFRENLPELELLGRPCSCTIPHEILQGKVQVPEDGKVQWYWKTTVAGRYPAEFRHLAAKVFARSCPRSGYRCVDEATLHPAWARSLELSGCGPIPQLQVGTCDRVSARTEWENATRLALTDGSRDARLKAERRLETARQSTATNLPARCLALAPRPDNCPRGEQEPPRRVASSGETTQGQYQHTEGLQRKCPGLAPRGGPGCRDLGFRPACHRASRGAAAAMRRERRDRAGVLGVGPIGPAEPESLGLSLARRSGPLARRGAGELPNPRCSTGCTPHVLRAEVALRSDQRLPPLVTPVAPRPLPQPACGGERSSHVGVCDAQYSSVAYKSELPSHCARARVSRVWSAPADRPVRLWRRHCDDKLQEFRPPVQRQSGLTNFWMITFLTREGGTRSKTGETDPVKAVGQPNRRRSWVAGLCPLLLHLPRAVDTLLGLSQRRWLELLHMSWATVEVGAAVPHRLRHGGATADTLEGASDTYLTERGPRNSIKAFLRYRLPGRCIKESALLTPAQRQLSANLPRIILQEVTNIVATSAIDRSSNGLRSRKRR